MDSNLPPAQPIQDVQLLAVWRADARSEERNQAETQPPAEQPALSLKLEAPQLTKVLVRIDEQSGRFIQTLLDRTTQEVLLQYPSEEQLEFSRAISAYVRANRA